MSILSGNMKCQKHLKAACGLVPVQTQALQGLLKKKKKKVWLEKAVPIHMLKYFCCMNYKHYFCKEHLQYHFK